MAPCIYLWIENLTGMKVSHNAYSKDAGYWRGAHDQGTFVQTHSLPRFALPL